MGVSGITKQGYYPLGLDFFTAAAAGLVDDAFRVASLGNNLDVDTIDQPEDVWAGASLGLLNGVDHKLIPFLQAAGSVEVVSDNANDAAAGTGLRTLLVTYLDSNYVQKTTVVTLNGTTPVAFPEQIRAVNGMLRLTSGTFRGVNLGNISLRAAGGLGATYSYMQAGTGFARSSAFTVPAEHTFLLYSLLLAVNRIDTNDRTADFTLAQLSSAGALVKALEVAVGSTVPYRHEAQKMPIVTIAEKQTVWVSVEAVSISNTNVTAGFAGIVVKTPRLTVS